MIYNSEAVSILDDYWGPTWVQRINLERLDIRDNRWCMLGQLFGMFEAGVDELNLTGDEVECFKFDVDASYQTTVEFCRLDYSERARITRELYDNLTEEWKTVISDLRKQRTALC